MAENLQRNEDKMTKQKVVITDFPFPSRKPVYDVLDSEKFDIVFADLNDKEQFNSLCAEADGIIVTYADMNAGLIGSMKNCRIMARTGVAVNNLDVAAATKKNIYVTNVVMPQVVDVANHAVALLLTSIKKIHLLNEYVRSGHWSLDMAVPIYKMTGRKMGLLGFGHIAKEVAKRIKAFDVEVIAYDPYLPESVFAEHGVASVGFEELIREADYISVHMPLTPDTKNLISFKAFEGMKNSAYLINTSRGGIIDEVALADAVENKKIAGAALDVLATEFPSVDYPLYKYPNIIITPHSAYYSEECVVDLGKSAATEVLRVLSGEKPVSLVNRELL